jgi:ABC-type branched-subunit amino acid transport system ATPase component
MGAPQFASLQVLELTHRADAPVGSVTAAEAKRVAVGETLIGPSNVLLMDELNASAYRIYI